jgi:hypothetical protein
MGLRKPGILTSVSIFFSIYFLQRFLSEIYTKLFSDFSLSASNPGLLPEKWAHEKHIRLLRNSVPCVDSRSIEEMLTLTHNLKCFHFLKTNFQP